MDQHHRCPRQRVGVVEPFHGEPVAADPALVVVDRDHQLTAGGDGGHGIFHGPPEIAGVVQHSPGINDVEAVQGGEIIGIKHRTPLDQPVAVTALAVPECRGTGDRVAIVVEAADLGSQALRRQAEDAAAAADIEEPLTGKVVDAQ